MRGWRSGVVAMVSASLAVAGSLVGPTAVVRAAQDPPASTAGPDPSLEPSSVATLGADTSEFREDFEGDEAVFGEHELDLGRILRSDGRLLIRITEDDSLIRVAHVLDEQHEVVRIEGTVEVPGVDSWAGFQCGAKDVLITGLIDGDEWAVGRIEDGDHGIVERGDLTKAQRPSADEGRPLALECGRTGEGSTRALLLVDGQVVADLVLADDPVLQRLGLIAIVDEAPGTAAFDDLAAASGATYAPRGPAADRGVLANVPREIRSACEATEPTWDATDAVACGIEEPVGAAIYSRFATLDAMDAMFEGSTRRADTSESDGCRDGSYLGTYTHDDAPAGRLACFVDAEDGSAWIIWTHEGLLVGAMARTSSGDTQKLYEWWTSAGPVPSLDQLLSDLPGLPDSP